MVAILSIKYFVELYLARQIIVSDLIFPYYTEKASKVKDIAEIIL